MDPESHHADPGDVTRLLGEVRDGDNSASSRLFELVAGELRSMAGRYMRRERAGHTLQATALVNEVYMRLLAGQMPSLQDRAHFFAVAAGAMRRVLIDYARATRSRRRGGDMVRVELDSPLIFAEDNADEMIGLDRALTSLAALNERQSRIVELRFFVGLTEEEIAEMLDVHVRTVRRDWRLARAWLYAEIEGHSPVDENPES